MDRTSDLHLDVPGSIPGGTTIVANFSCEKNAKKLQHPNEIDTCDFQKQENFLTIF